MTTAKAAVQGLIGRLLFRDATVTRVEDVGRRLRLRRLVLPAASLCRSAAMPWRA